MAYRETIIIVIFYILDIVVLAIEFILIIDIVLIAGIVSIRDILVISKNIVIIFIVEFVLAKELFVNIKTR